MAGMQGMQGMQRPRYIKWVMGLMTYDIPFPSTWPLSLRCLAAGAFCTCVAGRRCTSTAS
jgi:hypothetical protein